MGRSFLIDAVVASVSSSLSLSNALTHSDQAAASPSTRSDKGKSKAKATAEQEKEQASEPQQASPSKSEPAVDAKSDRNESELAEDNRPKDAAEVPALERRPRRRSVLEDKESLATYEEIGLVRL